MRVKIIKAICNPEIGNYHPGQEADLPDEVAEKRIAAGHCVPVDEPKRGLVERLRRGGGRKSPKDEGPKEEDPKKEDGGEAVPVDKMTVPQLQTYAVEHGIDLGTATLKKDILAVIEAAQDED